MKHILILLLVFFGINAFADTVLLRDGSTPINCNIVSWSKEGLRISKDANSSQEVLPWYRIRKVSSEEIGIGLLSHLARGEMLWRAKLRLLRGDIALATPLFKEVFMHLKNSDGDDAYLAAEGLLRCHLANGNINESVMPWLSVVDHIQTGRDSQLQVLSSIIDKNTLLCPHLPPVWDFINVQKSLKTLQLKSDIAQAFYIIITSPLEFRDQALLGPLFLQQLFLLMDGNEIIFPETAEFQEWQQCWLLFAEATGLQKNGEEDKAMLQFAKVASMYQTSQPWLAGASMITLLESFDRVGNTKVADNLIHEISRVLPYHPLRKE